jgi:hypothetical protein
LLEAVFPCPSVAARPRPHCITRLTVAPGRGFGPGQGQPSLTASSPYSRPRWIVTGATIPQAEFCARFRVWLDADEKEATRALLEGITTVRSDSVVAPALNSGASILRCCWSGSPRGDPAEDACD